MKNPKSQFVFYLGLIILVSSIPGNSVPQLLAFTWDKFLHIIEYFILGLMGYRAFKIDIENPAILVISFGILFACLDETWQSMIPGRFSSHYDVMADGIGVIFGTIGSYYIFNKSK